MAAISPIEIIYKYNKRPLEYGVFDCNLMVLELVGYDISIIPKYDNLKDGSYVLSKMTDSDSPLDYIESIGYEEINPLYAYDGDIVIQGIHCFIYYDSRIFGISKETNCFELMQFDFDNQSKFQVYRNNKVK